MKTVNEVVAQIRKEVTQERNHGMCNGCLQLVWVEKCLDQLEHALRSESEDVRSSTKKQVEGWVRIVRAFQMYYPDWSTLGGSGVEKIEAIVHQLPELIRRHNSAVATLNQLGYTDEGGKMWKPPLLAKPMLESKILKIMRDCAKENTLAWPHEYEGFIVSVVQRALASDRINVIAEFLDKTGQYVTNDVTREAAISDAVKKALSEQGVPSWLLIEDAYDGVGMLIGHRLTIKNGGSCLIFHDQNRIPGFRVGDDFLPQIGGTVEYRRVSQAARTTESLDMVLYCPSCGQQHIDKDETKNRAHAPNCNLFFDMSNHGCNCGFSKLWNNPPHRTHLCASCGHQWRPADVATNGVEDIKTHGARDSVKPTAPMPLFDIDVSDLTAFRKMCDRALNTWNDAPEIIWKFSDMIDEKLKGVQS